jgi:hypothetical protein
VTYRFSIFLRFPKLIRMSAVEGRADVASERRYFWV